MHNRIYPTDGGNDGVVKGNRHVAPKAGAARLRTTSFAIMAALPSSRAHQSHRGTHLARREMSEAKQRRKRDGAKNKRGTLTMATIESAAKKGLNLTADDDMDEVERMKQMEIIKQMPISIPVKRQIRNKLLEGGGDNNFADCCSAHFYKQKVNCYRCKVKCMLNWHDFRSVATLFRGSFKRIDGHYGAGVLTYFKFLKWLFQINLVLALASGLFIILPQMAFGELDYSAAITGSANITEAENISLYCSAIYEASGNWSNNDGVQYILDFLQGTGFMEQTCIFYGYYSDRELDLSSISWNYNMPLAFLCVVVFIFGFSLVAMVMNTAKGFRERMFTSHGSQRQYCNKVFAGWDCSMTDTKNCFLRHKSIFRDITGNLEEQNRDLERANYSRTQKCKIYTLRVIINIIVVALLGGSGFLIYFVTIQQIQLTSSADFSSYSRILQFLIEFMTSLTITSLNGLVPVIFKKVVNWEDYSPATVVNVTLTRTVFLRLASLAVLMFTIYSKISCGPKDACNVGTGTCTQLMCWETYVGQEFYKLVVMDFIIVICMIFLVEFPRKLIISKCKCKLSRIIGFQQFDISKNVLDLIYSQTLLWLGSMFSPMIPIITVVKFFVIFYLKELTTLVNYAPPDGAAQMKSTEASSFISLLLMCSFFTTALPVFYVIWEVAPSKSCGPFRIYSEMYRIIPTVMESWPGWFRSFLSVISGTAIQIPIYVILTLIIYYLNSMISAFKEMVRILKEQLAMEGQDKQFLLRRIQELTKASGGDKDKHPGNSSIPEEPSTYQVQREKTESIISQRDVKISTSHV